MKTFFTILIIFGLFSCNSVSSQSLQDTKDYINEKIEANPPLGNIVNKVWFKDDINLEFLSYVLGIQATEDYLSDDLIIFCRTQYSGSNRSKFLFANYFTFHIGDISKVSISPNTTIKDATAYNINLYLVEKPLAVKFVEYSIGDNEYHLDFGRKIDIIIGGDESLAKKLKSAFIHFGSLYKITIKDGDVF